MISSGGPAGELGPPPTCVSSVSLLACMSAVLVALFSGLTSELLTGARRAGAPYLTRSQLS